MMLLFSFSLFKNVMFLVFQMRFAQGKIICYLKVNFSEKLN